MATLQQNITLLRTETAEASVSPERLAEIYQQLKDEIDNVGESSSAVPADLQQKLDAIGSTSSNALTTAQSALSSSSTASQKAEQALTKATQALSNSSSAAQFDTLTDAEMQSLLTAAGF